MSFDIDEDNGQSVCPDDDNEEYTADHEDHDMDIIKYTRTCGDQTQTICDWMYLWLIKPVNLGRHFDNGLQAVQYVLDITEHMNRRDLHVWCRQVGICKLTSSQLKTHLQILLLREDDDTGELDIDYDATYMPASFKHSETEDWFCTLVRGDYESHDYVGGQWIIREGGCTFGDQQIVITCAHNGQDMHSPQRQAYAHQPAVYELGKWMQILDANGHGHFSVLFY